VRVPQAPELLVTCGIRGEKRHVARLPATVIYKAASITSGEAAWCVKLLRLSRESMIWKAFLPLLGPESGHIKMICGDISDLRVIAYGFV
jgi:hypothetical protein